MKTIELNRTEQKDITTIYSMKLSNCESDLAHMKKKFPPTHKGIKFLEEQIETSKSILSKIKK